MEVGQVKTAALASDSPLSHTNALSCLRGISWSGGAAMAGYQHVGVGDAKVCYTMIQLRRQQGGSFSGKLLLMS